MASILTLGITSAIVYYDNINKKNEIVLAESLMDPATMNDKMVDNEITSTPEVEVKEERIEVYEGMIVGEHAKDNDLVVNVTKGKQQTNTRSSTKDTTVVLKRPRHFNLEACLDYINEDELVEVTPNNIRLRKKYLSELDRKRAYRSKNSASE